MSISEKKRYVGNVKGRENGNGLDSRCKGVGSGGLYIPDMVEIDCEQNSDRPKSSHGGTKMMCFPILGPNMWKRENTSSIRK